MKQLILVRHGKAVGPEEAFEDVDRPLKVRGTRDALTIAKTLKDKHIIPEKIVTSHAARACHTATIFAECLHIHMEAISLTTKLYAVSLKDVLELIFETDEKINSLLLVGHNPTFTFAANEFLKDPIFELPTSGVAVLNFNTESWKSISKENLTNFELFFPKKE